MFKATLFVLVLVVIVGLLIAYSVPTNPVSGSWASPQGTAVYAPTATDCPRCVPVGTAIYAPTDTPSFNR